MGKTGIILDPDEPKCVEEEIDQVFLFWTIRATVISTAFNPLLYGFLAKQYRTAYKYLLRVFFSKCCDCVEPPQENIFCKYTFTIVIACISFAMCSTRPQELWSRKQG